MSLPLSRRDLLQSLIGGLGLTGFLTHEGAHAAIPGRYADLRTPGKAKHVISLFLSGGPSQVDTFDPKPALAQYQGQRPGAVDVRTERETGGLMPTPFGFQQRGESGIAVSDILPNLGAVIDDICVIRSVYSFNPTHTPATSLWNTGSVLHNRPSIGSWVSYGLGSLNDDLPAFVGLSGARGSALRTGFLPARHQGTPFNNAEIDPVDMIPDLQNKWMDQAGQRRQLDAIQTLNREFSRSFGGDEYLEGRTQSLESAYRMQYAAVDAFDVRNEPESIREEYGTGTFATGCLLARRLVERGVRYVHVDAGRWDDHKDIEKNYRSKCPSMDQAAATLIRDLKRRGLLDETIVVWGGEFGRTPVSESGTGRDHNPYGYTMWLAGGGFRGGLAYGATDEFGFKAIENRASIHDLHATMLYALGMDHTKLTYRYAGRDFRLTDVFGEVVKDVLI
jgi:uncharacterized protein (DUF1501 family)